ncbi:hypothetical protein [Hydrogenophaga taeniospiralis]|uniref:hypothetical protein n=1 Tax=Hydrogenophaga taeniospiralis TaxID=65656 RepID=UPI001CFBC836|nr:hypothetical protein [Hydrogenophaga taeniospiralis]UCU92331.1 hypothetical protein KI616_15910 [Hydrogenophaga taeniospiralis]
MSSSVSHRKSTAPVDLVVNGNGAKYLSYREAWARIKRARQESFFLEAVTIEESIISDRLLSFLEKRCGLVLKNTTKGNFNQIIQRWFAVAMDRHAGRPAELEALTVLNERLQVWRSGRNEVVHGMVKSKASHSADHIANFLIAAETHAHSGEKLARAVEAWVRRQGKL